MSYEFGDVTQLKSLYSVLTTTRNTTTLRRKYPILSTHQIAQVRNGQAQTSTPPVSIHAEGVRVSTGRLPKKRSGHFFIRQKAIWINPPHFSNVSALRASQPSLLDALLSDAITSSLSNVDSKPLRMRDDTVPTGWKFNIHEDTKNKETGNLLIHSATTFDMSDDKAGINAKADR